ncbi:MAG: flagellar motor switch phosphatase FliY [Defluviitaleaceae bacterium]|nr:flagellar motor switch phosphatase FliY [Defluviitaleaceae bacterium]
MGDMLTQEEINALLSGGDDSDSSDESLEDLIEVATDATTQAVFTGNEPEILASDETLTEEQKDVLGEIGNISMGTAATTLFTLLNGQKVQITTPKVTIKNWLELSRSYDRPCVGIKVNYTEGLTGTNVLILKEQDVKVIADLMMGGEGIVAEDPDPLTELELSAIGEAMNQMVGSSSTSLSSVVKRKIDIDTPQAIVLNFGDDDFFEQTGFIESDVLACVAFRMEIGDLIDSEIMQIIPIDFARDMVNKMMDDLTSGSKQEDEVQNIAVAEKPHQETVVASVPIAATPQASSTSYAPRQSVVYPGQAVSQNVNVQPAQFQTLDMTELAQQKENIDIIMDVPLEVTVELGRTNRKIKEILEFTPGTIVDLDKLAGEPIDILVNGKFVATGEVVVVDENFAVRVTDILSVDKRI